MMNAEHLAMPRPQGNAPTERIAMTQEADVVSLAQPRELTRLPHPSISIDGYQPFSAPQQSVWSGPRGVGSTVAARNLRREFCDSSKVIMRFSRPALIPDPRRIAHHAKAIPTSPRWHRSRQSAPWCQAGGKGQHDHPRVGLHKPLGSAHGLRRCVELRLTGMADRRPMPP